jgi:hypothetical protein
LADLEGPALTCRPIGERTVCGPLACVTGAVVVVVDVDVLVVELAVVGGAEAVVVVG